MFAYRLRRIRLHQLPGAWNGSPRESRVKNLIEALTIFSKYTDTEWPTCCEHDTLYVLVDPKLVSEEDKKRLDELGFVPGDEEFHSYRYGSA